MLCSSMKFSIWQIFCHAAVLLLSFGIAAQASAQTANQGQLKPEIILQLGHQAPVSAVRWVNGGKHLVSLAEDGSIVFWDAQSGIILDRVQVPGTWLNEQNSRRLYYYNFDVGRNGKTAALIFTEDGKNRITEPDFCPLAANRGGFWCSFSLNLETREIIGDQTVIIPDDLQDAGDEEPFPLSPDGLLRPRPNHDNGIHGLIDPNDEHYAFNDSTCTSRDRCRYGVNLVPQDEDQQIIALTGSPRSYLTDVDVTADGRHLVKIESLKNDTESRIETLDVYSSTETNGFLPGRPYHDVRWLSEGRYTLFSNGYVATNDMPKALEGFPPALIVDQDCAKDDSCSAVESYGDMQALSGENQFLGVGSLSGCFKSGLRHECLVEFEEMSSNGSATHLPLAASVSMYSSARKWRLVKQPDWDRQTITAIKLSPNYKQLAVATRERDDDLTNPDSEQLLRVWLFDISGETLVSPPREIAKFVHPLSATIENLLFDTPEGMRREDRFAQIIREGGISFDNDSSIENMYFTPDGNKILFTQSISAHYQDSDLVVVDSSGNTDFIRVPDTSTDIIPISNDHVVDLYKRQIIDVRKGEVVASIAGNVALIKGGPIEQAKLFWAATEDGAIEFWDSENFTKLLTFYTFPDNRFFAVTPEGRYDTNLSPDTDMVRWIVPDAPWQSLALQTFMRDFYEPGLYRKLLECRAVGDCATQFKLLPSFADLTRVLPRVKIVDVSESKDGRQATVSFEATEGVDKNAANGGTKSGLFSPRLFLNNRLIGQYPNEPYVVGADVSNANETLDQWQEKNRVKIKSDADGVYRYGLTVQLPTGSGTEQLNFSAYAFNESRIKSDTATFVYQRKIKPIPRKPRAYVISIGINDYNEDRLDLNYAEPDAHLIADRLKTISGYEVRQLVLAGNGSADGRPKPTDKLMIQSALALVMSERDRGKYLTRLRTAEVDARMLEASTADDIVIISFSGHGWADKDGDFYLLPSDGKWPDAQNLPDASTLLSTTDITYLLRATQAADISLIIDACHSGASVDSGDFKPGPMGDRGLGQLAFDKGIRILTAAQASDVALEDASLSHGLLTYALAGDDGGGITAESGHAERDEKGRILLDKWLSYAIKRLPELATDKRLSGLGGADRSNGSSFFFPGRTATRKQKIQQPVLFDFNSRPSFIALREQLEGRDTEGDNRQ